MMRHAVLLLLVLAPRALAEPVTHRFTGQVTSFGGALGLSSLFPAGTTVTLDCTVERNTPGVPEDSHVTTYTDAVTMVAFTVGSWSGGSAPSSSNATATDNEPSPAPPGNPYDQWTWNVLGVQAPALGTVMFQTLTSTLDDVDATVFDSSAIPRLMPALGAFEGKTATFLFFDFSSFQSGYFMATLSEVSTPARGTSWGGIKALYRD